MTEFTLAIRLVWMLVVCLAALLLAALLVGGLV